MTKPKRLDDLIVAILTEARAQSRAKLVKTALVKFVYLADVYAAEDSPERYTLTRLPWRFVHFGPYAYEIEQAFERLEMQRVVQIDRRQKKGFEHAEDEGRYELLSLASASKAQDFNATSVPRSVAIRLRSDLRRYADDVPRLLDYVYFSTEPMRLAEPGRVLDFGICSQRRPEDFQHPEGRKLSQKKVSAGRARIRELALMRRDRLRGADEQFGPYDEIYYQGIAQLDDHSPVPDLDAFAKLDTKPRSRDE